MGVICYLSFVGCAFKSVIVNIFLLCWVAVLMKCSTLLFVYSLRLAKLNEEMKESDYGIQGQTYW